MSIIRGGEFRKIWWVRGLVLAAALLALATGFCLFDQDHDGAPGHVTAPDLCLGMLAAALAVMPLVRLSMIGWAASLLVAVPCSMTLHLPDPPPKPASLL